MQAPLSMWRFLGRRGVPASPLSSRLCMALRGTTGFSQETSAAALPSPPAAAEAEIESLEEGRDALEHSVQRLSVTVRKLDALFQEQQKQVSALRHHVLLLEQRLSGCEASDDQQEQRATELWSTVGELRLETANAEQLVRQLEKQMQLAAPPQAVAADRSASEVEPLSETVLQAICSAVTKEWKTRAEPPQPDGQRGRTAEPSHWEALERRLERLETQQLTQDVPRQTPSSAAVKEAGVEVNDVSDSTSSTSPRASLIQQLRVEGIVPFRTSGGVQFASTRVRVCGAPLFWGAAHVRQLCEQRVGGVVTCLLAKSSAGNNNSKSDKTPPCRDFEVEFRSTQQAIRAIVTLTGFVAPGHPSRAKAAGSTPHPLTVEPVLSPELEELVEELKSLPPPPGAPLHSSEEGADREEKLNS